MENQNYKRTPLPADAPFTALGWKHNDRHEVSSLFVYRDEETGRQFSLDPAEHDQRHLLQLAPLAWFKTAFPAANGGVNWLAVVDAAYGACEAAGRLGDAR